MTSITLPLSRNRSFSLTSLFATTDSAALFTLRVALGLVMLPHGLQKTLGWFGGSGFSGTLGWFASIGIPTLLGVAAIAAESLGALALITGIGTRLAALVTAVNMLVAVALVHGRFGFFMNWFGNQKGEGFEYHILAIAMAVALVIGGAGRWSFDRLLSERS